MTEAERHDPDAESTDDPADLSISSVSSDGARVVRLAGELDLNTAPRAEQALTDELDPGARNLIVDLRDLEFCDAAGLRVFVRARRRAHDAGMRLRLVHPSRMVQRLLDVAELSWLLADPSRSERSGSRGFLASVSPQR